MEWRSKKKISNIYNHPTFPVKLSKNSIFFSIDIPRESVSPVEIKQNIDPRENFKIL